MKLILLDEYMLNPSKYFLVCHYKAFEDLDPFVVCCVIPLDEYMLNPNSLFIDA